MFILFNVNRRNSLIYNYEFRYFIINTSLGDIVWRCMQKECSVTIITNNEKTVLIRTNIFNYHKRKLSSIHEDKV